MEVKSKYLNTVIYKIVCKDTNISDSYVGHTTNFLSRLKDHRSCCNNPNSKSYNIYVYKFIRNHGGFANWSMEAIEQYPCYSKEDALKRERYYIEELATTLNKTIPCRTYKEYYRDNLDMFREYYEMHKESNREVKLESCRQYYQKNKDALKAKVAERNSQIYTCICGAVVTFGYKQKHLANKKHNLNMNRLKNLFAEVDRIIMENKNLKRLK